MQFFGIYKKWSKILMNYFYKKIYVVKENNSVNLKLNGFQLN